MSNDQIRSQVNDYYTRKILEHGPTARGSDWNSEEAQNLRFEVLISLMAKEKEYSILDFGCGYGALLSLLRKKDWHGKYWGFDLSESMTKSARECHAGYSDAIFVNALTDTQACDYVLSSGVFNVKGETSDIEWISYMHETIEQINTLSLKGFSFNVLTSYSDIEKRRRDLYYADPCYWFDYCKRNYGKYVSLYHDYPLWEFTLCVRKK